MILYLGDINILADLPDDWQERLDAAYGVILVYAKPEDARGKETKFNTLEVEDAKD